MSVEHKCVFYLNTFMKRAGLSGTFVKGAKALTHSNLEI